METKKESGKFFRTLKGQAVIFLLVWSSCNTMTYFIAMEDNRKAVRISKDYTEYDALIEGVDLYRFQFPDGENMRVKYSKGQSAQKTVFFSVGSNIKGYLKHNDLSFRPDSTLVGTTFPLVISNEDQSLFMDAGEFEDGLENKDIIRHMKIGGLVWAGILVPLWFIGWILYRVNSDESILNIPEKDIRSRQVLRAKAEVPDDWDEDL
ncbi:MAG: hypothetical protein VX244_03170 [Candidatus Neomarinimicrobiota bacterium]|nr:hypothetical protein [Candidatus Neomarinimicrobiota bacterium]